MQLPSKFKKTATQKPASKYPDSAVKMLVVALGDINQNKFKSGWFSMIRYEYEVYDVEKKKIKNQALRDELVENSKIPNPKPETWLTHLDLGIVNKFKEEALGKNNFEEEKGAAPEQKRIQIGQSKVGKKKFTRGISSANDGAPAAIPSFKKKFNLQLGNAVKTFEEKAVNIDMPMGPGTAPMAPPPMSQP